MRQTLVFWPAPVSHSQLALGSRAIELLACSISDSGVCEKGQGDWADSGLGGVKVVSVGAVPVL